LKDARLILFCVFTQTPEAHAAAWTTLKVNAPAEHALFENLVKLYLEYMVGKC